VVLGTRAAVETAVAEASHLDRPEQTPQSNMRTGRNADQLFKPEEDKMDLSYKRTKKKGFRRRSAAPFFEEKAPQGNERQNPQGEELVKDGQDSGMLILTPKAGWPRTGPKSYGGPMERGSSVTFSKKKAAAAYASRLVALGLRCWPRAAKNSARK